MGGGISDYYIVILADRQYVGIRENLENNGFHEYEDYYDYFPNRAYLPFSVLYNNTKIGKCTYHNLFGVTFTRIKEIGNYCGIASGADVVVNHPMDWIVNNAVFLHYANKVSDVKFRTVQTNQTGDARVRIGNDVWIGANAVINASRCASIGDGAIIGSNALVLADVPPYAIVYGSPARIGRYRFTQEQIEILLRVKWWNWDDDTMRENIELLVYPDKFFEKFG